MRGRRVVPSTLRVAADVGGTFTDTCISDTEPVNMRIEKVPPTADPIEVVLDGAEKPAVRARSRSRKLQSLPKAAR
jgi:N-methylhydantoinase A/oxoprolinase/acetone carboxylase beta subunit